jgi:large subunit ribosomal protein L4
MSSLKVYNTTGGEVGTYDFPENLIEQDKGSQAVRDVVVAHLAAKRQGSASTKSKGEVAGSGKKPWKQKGTGRARAGYRQSPVWRGGGTVFGPKPRSYAKKVNRKVARLAFRRALGDKLASSELRVVEAFNVAEPKTKCFSNILESLGIERKALIIVDQLEPNLALASRNITGVEVVMADDVNVYQLLRYSTVVVNSAGLDKLKARLENGVQA